MTFIINPARFAPAGPTVIVSDSFDRANGAIGTADTAQVWTEAVGTFTVASNQATTATGDGLAVVEGAADGTLEVSGLAGTSPGTPVSSLVFRYSDTNNFWYVYDYHGSGSIALRKKQGGSDTEFASAGRTGSGGWHDYKAVLSGTSIQIYLDGTLKISTTSSFNQTATKVGLRSSAGASAGSTWDDLSMTA